jgi:hypothetical protein
MLLVLRADETRAGELRTIGRQLAATARRLVAEALGEDGDEEAVEEQVVTVRAWAAGLDRATCDAELPRRRRGTTSAPAGPVRCRRNRGARRSGSART